MTPEALGTVEALQARLEPFAQIPKDLETLLRADQQQRRRPLVPIYCHPFPAPPHPGDAQVVADRRQCLGARSRENILSRRCRDSVIWIAACSR